MKKLIIIVILGIGCLTFLGCGNTVKSNIVSEKVSKITLNGISINKSEYNYFINELNNLIFTEEKEPINSNYEAIYIKEKNKIHSFYLYNDGNITYTTNEMKTRYFYKDKIIAQKLIKKINKLNEK